MLLRSLFLLLLSSQVFSAGITIDIDLDMTIGEIIYNDGLQPTQPDIEEIYINYIPVGDCTETDYESQKDMDWLSTVGYEISYSQGEYAASANDRIHFYDNLDWHIFDNFRGVVTRNWDVSCPDNPRNLQIDTNVNYVLDAFFLRDSNINILSTRDYKYYFRSFDATSNEMMNNLPYGTFEWIKEIDNEIYINVFNASLSGIWKIGLENIKLMNTGINSQADILKVGGDFALFSEDVTLRVKFPATKKEFKIESSDDPEYSFYSSNFGVVVSLRNEEGIQFKWLNGYKIVDISFQNDFEEIYGCYQSGVEVFCLGKQDGPDTVMWRLESSLYGGARFVVDAILSHASLSNKNVEGIYYSSDHRAIVISDDNHRGLLLVNSTETTYRDILSYGFKSIDSGRSGAFYDFDNGLIVVSILSNSSSASELESLVEVEDIQKPIINDKETEEEGTLEERDASEIEPRPRAELSGAVSMYYLFAMMLVLLVGRRKA